MGVFLFIQKSSCENKNEKSQKMRIKLDKIRGFATKKRENDAPSYLFLVELEFNIVLLFVQHKSALEPLEFL